MRDDEITDPKSNLDTSGDELIEGLMERASVALLRRGYFETVLFCQQALRLAVDAAAFDAAARIVLPLQEARRQIRQLAVDAAESAGVMVLRSLPNTPKPGCYVLEPPAIGIDASAFRNQAEAVEIPVFVLCREPTPQKGPHEGTIPLVGVGGVSVRAYVDRPDGSEDAPETLNKVRLPDELPLEWFEAAGEALGDAAIRSVPADDPAAWRVLDLMERLEAVPEHEKLHQRMADACRKAYREPAPATPRRRSIADDPFSF